VEITKDEQTILLDETTGATMGIASPPGDTPDVSATLTIRDRDGAEITRHVLSLAIAITIASALTDTVGGHERRQRRDRRIADGKWVDRKLAELKRQNANGEPS
jgi:hypothetical protein